MAAADVPTAGARYDGPSGGGALSFIEVSRDGRSLADYLLDTRARCSDGRRRFIGLDRRGEELTAISADGSSRTPPRVGAYRIRERATIRLRFFRGRSGTFDVFDSFRATTVIYRGGRRVDRCRAHSSIRGRLGGGPQNDPQ